MNTKQQTPQFKFNDRVITHFGYDDNVEMTVLYFDGKNYLLKHDDPTAMQVWRCWREVSAIEPAALETITEKFGDGWFMTSQVFEIGIGVEVLVGLKEKGQLISRPVSLIGIEWRVVKQDSITAVRTFFASMSK